MNLLHHFLVSAVIFGAFEDEVFASDQFAAADEEDLHAGFAVCARHGQHIRILVIGGKDDLLSFDDGVDGFQLVAQCGGFLEAHFFGGFFHLGFEGASRSLRCVR